MVIIGVASMLLAAEEEKSTCSPSVKKKKKKREFDANLAIADADHKVRHAELRCCEF